MYGGWGKAPIGFVPGESGAECSFTDAQFNADLFSISTSATTETSSYDILETGVYPVENNSRIFIPYQIKEDDVVIHGMKQGDTPSNGVFSVRTSEQNAMIQFADGDVENGD